MAAQQRRVEPSVDGTVARGPVGPVTPEWAPAPAPSRLGPASSLHALQRLVGNRAVTHLVTARRGAPGAEVVQRQVLSRLDLVKIDDEYWIFDVIIGGRTPSPFPGTMGAHSTAWVAHIDEVRRYLVNQPLPTAAEQLVGLVEEEVARDAGSLYELRTSLEHGHQKLLTGARGQAGTRAGEVRRLLASYAAAPDPVALQSALRALVNDYLTFVNFLPAATVKGGDPLGHGEGTARGEITQFEYVYALYRRGVQAGAAPTPATSEEAPLLASALERLPKGPFGQLVKGAHKAGFATASCGELVQKLSEDLWSMFAAETPGVFARATKSDTLRVWTLLLQTFLGTISRAYPYTFDFTGMHHPGRQLEGLLWALKDAGVAMNPTFWKTLRAVVEGGLVEEAAIRDLDVYAEVAMSDLTRGGSGFQVTVLVDGSGLVGDIATVGEVEMIGRTQSPFSGTMGAHSTAWIAHLDALQNALRGKPVGQACAIMVGRARGALKDPALKFAHLVDEKHQGYLLGAYNALVKTIEAATSSGGPSTLDLVQLLERLIFEYLTYLNFLPMSTVATGGVPGGRREGQARRLLLAYEEAGPAAIPEDRRRETRTILRDNLLSLYDPNAVKAFPPDLGERERPSWATDPAYGYGPKHPLWRAFRSAAGAEGKEDLALHRLYTTLLEAYPRSLADSGLLEEARAGRAVGREVAQELAGEEAQLRGLLTQNNCLIRAIADSKQKALTFDHIVAIRRRIGEIGTMLVASPRTISIICDVLGIGGVVVVYPHPLPSEGFGDQANPAVIQHTGHDHFVPFTGHTGPVNVRTALQSGPGKRKAETELARK